VEPEAFAVGDMVAVLKRIDHSSIRRARRCPDKEWQTSFLSVGGNRGSQARCAHATHTVSSDQAYAFAPDAGLMCDLEPGQVALGRNI